MPAIFIHVSDIHFGQERDERVHIHSDVKEQLIADAAEFVRSMPGGVVHGILVTGDVAFSGKREQYEAAGEWLDKLARAVGCEIYRITQAIERKLLDWLIRQGRIVEVKKMIDDLIANRGSGG